jgi:hypothetical protein
METNNVVDTEKQRDKDMVRKETEILTGIFYR